MNLVNLVNLGSDHKGVTSLKTGCKINIQEFYSKGLFLSEEWDRVFLVRKTKKKEGRQ